MFAQEFGDVFEQIFDEEEQGEKVLEDKINDDVNQKTTSDEAKLCLNAYKIYIETLLLASNKQLIIIS